MESLRSHLVSELRESIQLFITDLRALPSESIAVRPNDATRSPLDITCEVIEVMNRAAARMRGEDPGPWPYTDSFMRAPEGQTLDGVCDGLVSSSESAIEAFGEDPFRSVNGTPVYQSMMFLVLHSAYHDGQLNYIQTLGGDDKINWKF